MSEIASEMRAAIITLAGDRSWGLTRERWLENAARTAGISFRAAKALFYAEDREPRASTVENVRRAIAKRRKHDAEARTEVRQIMDGIACLVARLAAVDEEFHREAIAALGLASHAAKQSED